MDVGTVSPLRGRRSSRRPTSPRRQPPRPIERGEPGGLPLMRRVEGSLIDDWRQALQLGDTQRAETLAEFLVAANASLVQRAVRRRRMAASADDARQTAHVALLRALHGF